MQPGETVTCSSCGATSEPASYSGGEWREGWPVMVTWSNGPFPRHDLAGERQPALELCAWCDDKAHGFPALSNRPLPSEAPWSAGGPKIVFGIPAIGALGRALDRDGGSATATAPVPVSRPSPNASTSSAGEDPLEPSNTDARQLSLF